MHLPGVRRGSVRLHVPFAHSPRAAAAGLLLWAGQVGDVDRWQQHGVGRANARSATLLADVGS